MSDREISRGAVSFLRKPHKKAIHPHAPGDLRQVGVKSFALSRRSVAKRRAEINKTFSKGLIKSLVRKK